MGGSQYWEADGKGVILPMILFVALTLRATLESGGLPLSEMRCRLLGDRSRRRQEGHSEVAAWEGAVE